MEISNLIALFETARLQAQQTGFDSLYLLLGGLLAVLITASVLITLLVWLRYLTAAAVIVISVVSFFRWRNGGNGTEKDCQTNMDKHESFGGDDGQGKQSKG